MYCHPSHRASRRRPHPAIQFIVCMSGTDKDKTKKMHGFKRFSFNLKIHCFWATMIHFGQKSAYLRALLYQKGPRGVGNVHFSIVSLISQSLWEPDLGSTGLYKIWLLKSLATKLWHDDLFYPILLNHSGLYLNDFIFQNFGLQNSELKFVTD